MGENSFAFTVEGYRLMETHSEKYILYLVCVNCEVNSWKVELRYTDFKVLKEKIERKLKISLPFPGKLWFTNFQHAALQKRARALQLFLNELSQKVDIATDPDACSLFGIDDCTRTLLSLSKSTYIPRSFPRVFERSREIVNEFLFRINNDNLNRSKTVKEFEHLFFQNCFEFKKADIKALFWGTTQYRGLLYFCGEIKHPIAGRACMEFFGKLIKYVNNSTEAEKFLAVFCITEPSVVRAMHLDFHIVQVGARESIGLVAAYYYLLNNNHDVSDPGDILESIEAIKQYNSWVRNKIACGYLTKYPLIPCLGNCLSESDETVEDESIDQLDPYL